MDILNLPTKRNMLLARQRLALARIGYDLLDKKRQVLARELAVVQGRLIDARENLHSAIKHAYDTLSFALMEIGHEMAVEVSNSIPKNTRGDIFFRSIMGAEMLLVNIPPEDTGPWQNGETDYNLNNTTTSLDNAVLAWKEALRHIIALGVIENEIYQLNIHTLKTQKRANALGNVTIPKYELRVRYIQDQLEERERDEMARLKVVKNRFMTSFEVSGKVSCKAKL